MSGATSLRGARSRASSAYGRLGQPRLTVPDLCGVRPHSTHERAAGMRLQNPPPDWNQSACPPRRSILRQGQGQGPGGRFVSPRCCRAAKGSSTIYKGRLGAAPPLLSSSSLSLSPTSSCRALLSRARYLQQSRVTESVSARQPLLRAPRTSAATHGTRTATTHATKADSDRYARSSGVLRTMRRKAIIAKGLAKAFKAAFKTPHSSPHTPRQDRVIVIFFHTTRRRVQVSSQRLRRGVFQQPRSVAAAKPPAGQHTVRAMRAAHLTQLRYTVYWYVAFVCRVLCCRGVPAAYVQHPLLHLHPSRRTHRVTLGWPNESRARVGWQRRALVGYVSTSCAYAMYLISCTNSSHPRQPVQLRSACLCARDVAGCGVRAHVGTGSAYFQMRRESVANAPGGPVPHL